MVDWFAKRSKTFWAIMGIILIAEVGFIDFLTGYEIAFSLFYLIPIALVTWFTGTRLGIVASIVSGIVWLIADFEAGQLYSHPAIIYWNSLIRFGFFIIVTFLLTALSKEHEREKELARIDSLTGAVNARFFSELIHMEINRAQRINRPFTLAYLDLDNFKSVNDRFGHRTGDMVLCTIVARAKGRLRNTDVVGRLGGDEFAFLLPETDQTAAQVVISKIKTTLLEEMTEHDWPVTFSIGVLTCIGSPQTSEELLNLADKLMYSVKNNSKNEIRYSTYSG